jgi:hypothetical protein
MSTLTALQRDQIQKGNTMKAKLNNGHANGNGLFNLARERALLLDGELELSCGPHGSPRR